MRLGCYSKWYSWLVYQFFVASIGLLCLYLHARSRRLPSRTSS